MASDAQKAVKALKEECRQAAIRAAGGRVVKASDGTVMFDADTWEPTALDWLWIQERLAADDEMSADDYVIQWRASTAEGRDWITHQAPPWATLAEIVDVCKEHGVEATLYDESGCVKGWVHADGNWRLS